MSSLFTPNRVETAFWLTICGGLLVGVGLETNWGRQLGAAPYSDTHPQGNFDKPVLAEPYHLPTPDTMLETATRPLFVVTRRPAPTVEVAPQSTMNKGQFTLTGVSIVPQGKFAFLLERASKRNLVVAEGKEINGITIKEVQPDQVILVQNADSEVLLLTVAKGPAVPPSIQSPPGARSSPQPQPSLDPSQPSAPPSQTPPSTAPTLRPPRTPPPQNPQSAPANAPPNATSSGPAKVGAGPI
jgi:hypothetical protein